MIVIIDYGMGNLRSVQKALEKVGAQTVITQNERDIEKAQKIVLPGVGAMKPAMEKLSSLKLIRAIKQSIASGKPFMGICLGLQLLFDKSDEGGGVDGLSVLNGEVRRFKNLKVPHMGWNQLNIKNTACPLLQGLDPLTNVYFCHSYYVQPNESDVQATTTNYGLEFASSVYKDNVFGVQFHPEKSQDVGLKILKNFVEFK